MYQYEMAGYELADGTRETDKAPSEALLPEVEHVLVFAYNTDDPEDHHYFWAHALYPFEDWESWDYYIADLMAGYGMTTPA